MTKKHYCFGCRMFFKAKDNFIAEKPKGMFYIGFHCSVCGDEMQGDIWTGWTDNVPKAMEIAPERDISAEIPQETKSIIQPIIKKRGRPPGALNKSTMMGRAVATNSGSRKRGRPRKNA